MKIFIKLMILVLVLGLAGPFVLKGPDGRPWMSVDDLGINSGALSWERLSLRAKGLWSEVTGGVSRITGGEPARGTRIYRWRDSEGNWQYSDRPNPNGVSETIVVDSNTNVIQATPLSQPETKKESEVTAQSPQIGVPLPLTVNPGQVSKLIKDAKQVQELMNQRNDALEAISGTLPADD